MTQWIFVAFNWSSLHINTSSRCFRELFHAVCQSRSLVGAGPRCYADPAEQFSAGAVFELCQISMLCGSWLIISLIGDRKEVPQMKDPRKMAVLHLRPCFSDTPQIVHNPSLFLFAHSSNELVSLVWTFQNLSFLIRHSLSPLYLPMHCGSSTWPSNVFKV